ncbi:hypothetical protein VTO73DRAFT_8099 [Trametes versicolor]
MAKAARTLSRRPSTLPWAHLSVPEANLKPPGFRADQSPRGGAADLARRHSITERCSVTGKDVGRQAPAGQQDRRTLMTAAHAEYVFETAGSDSPAAGAMGAPVYPAALAAGISSGYGVIIGPTMLLRPGLSEVAAPGSSLDPKWDTVHPDSGGARAVQLLVERSSTVAPEL